MPVNRRAIVSVAIGLYLTLGGCSPTSPTPVSPSPPVPTPPSVPEPPTNRTTKVTVTVSSVAKATIAPEKFSYTFRFQLADSGGVPFTVESIDFEFDNTWSDPVHITEDALGEYRRLTANGTLDLELTCVPAGGWLVGNAVVDAFVRVNLIDDNGGRVWAVSSTVKL